MKGLHRFTVLVACATFVLIIAATLVIPLFTTSERLSKNLQIAASTRKLKSSSLR